MVTKERMDELKKRFENPDDREAVAAELASLCDEDIEAVCGIARQQMAETHAEVDAMLVKEQLKEISPMISLSYIAKTYFNKTRAWLCQRVNGSIVNGKPAEFTEEEKKTLTRALNDMGRQLMSVSIS